MRLTDALVLVYERVDALKRRPGVTVIQTPYGSGVNFSGADCDTDQREFELMLMSGVREADGVRYVCAEFADYAAKRFAQEGVSEDVVAVLYGLLQQAALVGSLVGNEGA